MPVPVIIGASLASVALLLYTIGILMTVISGKVRKCNVIMQTTAVICDAVATGAMIVQTGGLIPRDFHGWIGYTALTLMAIDLVFVYRHRKDGVAPVPLRVYAACALAFWMVSYSLGFMKM